MKSRKVAVIGLGPMGKNVALNLLDHGFKVICYSIFKEERNIFSREITEKERVFFPETIHELAKFFQEECKRLIFLIKAGDPVDEMLDSILPILKKEDILIDMGNSFYIDSKKRALRAGDKGIYFLDTGISGGQKGARHGSSLMVGGNKQAFQDCEDIFKALSASFQNRLCYHNIGPSGTGHFVKIVHNGIEYALMQIIAEHYFLLKNIFCLHPEEICSVFKRLNARINQSYLLEITIKILKAYDSFSGKLLLENINDRASQKGTGKWASIAALEFGSTASLIILATIERNLSSSPLRKSFCTPLEQSKVYNLKIEQWLPKIEQSLFLCSLLAYAQGFNIIQKASEVNKWNIELAPIAAIWRAGCIIQSSLLAQIEKAFQQIPNQTPLLSITQWDLSEKLKNLKDLVDLVIDYSAPVPLITNTQQYMNSLFCKNLPTNLIQAQRDFFGAHGFERYDQRGFFHHRWEEE